MNNQTRARRKANICGRRFSVSGFTLLELQVSILILMFAFAGLTAVLMNSDKQLKWLEKRRALYTVVAPGDNPKVIFTEYRPGLTVSSVVYKVKVQSLTEDETSVTAIALLEEK